MTKGAIYVNILAVSGGFILRSHSIQIHRLCPSFPVMCFIEAWQVLAW